MSDSYQGSLIAQTPTTYDIWLERVGEQPGATALIVDGKELTTYGELDAEVTRFRRLLAGRGLGRGSRVGLVVPTRDAFVTSFMAVTSCCTAAPLNPGSTSAELEFNLSDFGIDAVIVEDIADPRHAETAKRFGVDVITVSATAKAGVIAVDGSDGAKLAEPEMPQHSDILVVLHTSGTTSRPKIVPFTHHSRVIEFLEMARPRSLRNDDRCFCALPLHHGQGLIGEALFVLMAGASLVLSEFEPRSFIQQVIDSETTLLTLVPSMHQQVVEAADEREGVFRGSKLQYVRSTSAMMPPALLEEIRRVYGVPIMQQFAASECSNIAATELDPALNRPGSVGKTVRPGVVIMDEQGVELPAGEVGEICVKPGPLVIAGYENNPEANAEAFRDGYYRMGDAGYVDSDGFLYLAGRIKEVINRGGEKIAPAEVDEALLAHPAVASAAAFAGPDSKMGEEVMAAVVLRKGQDVSAAELRSFVGQRLSFAKVPKRIFVVDELPHNSVGKVVRRELTRLLESND